MSSALDHVKAFRDSPAHVAPLDLHLEGVIARLPIERRLDELIALNRPAVLKRNVLAGVVRPRLIVVAEDDQVAAAIADIGDVNQQVVQDLALNGHVPVLDVAGMRVRWDVVDTAIEGLKFAGTFRPSG